MEEGRRGEGAFKKHWFDNLPEKKREKERKKEKAIKKDSLKKAIKKNLNHNSPKTKRSAGGKSGDSVDWRHFGTERRPHT